jgi:hypothetical protein
LFELRLPDWCLFEALNQQVANTGRKMSKTALYAFLVFLFWIPILYVMREQSQTSNNTGTKDQIVVPDTQRLNGAENAQNELVALLPCPAGKDKECAAAIPYQKVWRQFEADNGEVTSVYMKDIGKDGDARNVLVHTNIPGAYDVTHLQRLFFDCAGHFDELLNEGGFSAWTDAPPQSVAGEIAAAICDR